MRQKQVFIKATTVDISDFAKIVDLASLKSETNQLDFGKLETNPVLFRPMMPAI